MLIRKNSHRTAFGCYMNRIARKLALATKQPERTDGRMAHIFCTHGTIFGETAAVGIGLLG